MDLKQGSGRDENRIPLYNVVPLDMPFTVSIGVSDFCNFKCKYCFHSTSISNYYKEAIITWDYFIYIMNNIEEMCNHTGKKLKNFSICGIGEPLMNKKIVDMVSYVKEKNISDRIEITTNGSLLTHDLSKGLIEAGLTKLLISVQGTSNSKYKEVCGYDINYEKFIDEIKYFYNNRKQCKIYTKTLDMALDNDDDIKKFYNIFSPISDVVNVENTLKGFDGVDYDGIVDKEKANSVTRYGYKYKKRICCDSLFIRMNVHSNGDVHACSCQWPPLVIGNINKLPLKDIWNGEIHRKYMVLHLRGLKDTIPRCAKCDSMSYSGHPMDNLDDHLEEILNRL